MVNIRSSKFGAGEVKKHTQKKGRNAARRVRPSVARLYQRAHPKVSAFLCLCHCIGVRTAPDAFPHYVNDKSHTWVRFRTAAFL